MNKSDFLDIVDIVGQYIQLTPEGPSHFIGKCPFCQAEDSLVLSRDTQYWHCMSCGLNGDRYDFVAKSEKIGRAVAILMVGHHTNTGESFPHARYTPAKPTAKVEARAPERAAAAAPAAPAMKQPEPARAQAAAAPPGPPAGAAEQAMAAPFRELRNLIPSYQGAALLDEKFKKLLADNDFPYSADLAAIGEILAPILERAGNVYSQSSSTLPATLTLASEDLAILVHQSGPVGKTRLFVVRLANPDDLPVARRLVASASAKLA
ncbi:MAG TPA: CHC2 zinc finger domain-containing protein [Gallionellaceae bacterium]